MFTRYPLLNSLLELPGGTFAGGGDEAIEDISCSAAVEVDGKDN